MHSWNVKKLDPWSCHEVALAALLRHLPRPATSDFTPSLPLYVQQMLLRSTLRLLGIHINVETSISEERQ